MIERIKQLAAKYYDEVRAIREHLHMHPELSFEEIETSNYISQKLTEKGISHERNWAGNGIVVNLINDKDFDTVALRADIDALPITEENDVEYRSKNVGVMHACGHDVHTSSLLGSIFILNALGRETGKNFKAIFQPAEEKLPGGASLLIKQGVLHNPVPKCIIGQHVHPPLEAGKVGFRSGLYMASADEIYLTVKGKGGHAALPQGNIDPIFISASLITSLQQVVSRRANPTIPTVLSFGKINSQGGATNVIPSEVKLEGTFRTMDEDWRKSAHQIIHQVCQGVAKAMGGDCEVNIVKGYPCLINERRTTEKARAAAQEYLGAENVVELPIRMTSEDFAFYTQETAACFYRLGTGNEAKGITSSVHSPTFDIDLKSLQLSSGLMAYLAIKQ
jgi:amidohydrolase